MPDQAPDGWVVQGGKLCREWSFADFSQAWAYMTRVALLAEKLDHHPDWWNSYGAVRIELVSHDRGELTARDYRFAEAINQLPNQ